MNATAVVIRYSLAFKIQPILIAVKEKVWWEVIVIASNSGAQRRHFGPSTVTSTLNM
jgi:hypothetical protein